MKKWEKDLMKKLSETSVDNKELVIKMFINDLIDDVVNFMEDEIPSSLGSQKHILIEKFREEYIRD